MDQENINAQLRGDVAQLHLCIVMLEAKIEALTLSDDQRRAQLVEDMRDFKRRRLIG